MCLVFSVCREGSTNNYDQGTDSRTVPMMGINVGMRLRCKWNRFYFVDFINSQICLPLLEVKERIVICAESLP